MQTHCSTSVDPDGELLFMGQLYCRPSLLGPWSPLQYWFGPQSWQPPESES